MPLFFLILAFLVALLFYLVIPGMGAIMIRQTWVDLRKNLLRAWTLPILDHPFIEEKLNKMGLSRQEMRIFGYLEAIEGSNSFWIRNSSISVKVQMGGNARVYLLPEGEIKNRGEGWAANSEVEEILEEEKPLVLKWKEITRLDRGIKVFVTGYVSVHDGQPGFYLSEQNPFVAFFEGEESSFLRRIIWGSRQRNEYWNSYTPVSLVMGSVFNFSIFYFTLPLFKSFPSLILMYLSAIPFVSLIPPGLFFLLFYRVLWNTARVMRGERDLLLVSERFFEKSSTDTCQLPNGEVYRKQLIRSKDIEYFRQKGAICRGLAVRRSKIGNSEAEKDGDLWLYGVEQPDGSLGPSRDPFVEFLILPENCLDLKKSAYKGAVFREIYSVLLFLTGFGINSALFLYIISNLFLK